MTMGVFIVVYGGIPGGSTGIHLMANSTGIELILFIKSALVLFFLKKNFLKYDYGGFYSVLW